MINNTTKINITKYKMSEKVCYFSTLLFYSSTFLLIICGIICFAISVINNSYDETSQLNIIGTNDQTVDCSEPIFTENPTFRFKQSNSNYNYQCGYSTTLTYLVFIGLGVSILINISLMLGSILFKRGTYSLFLHSLGIIISLYMFTVIIFQSVSIKNGYAFCEDVVTKTFLENTDKTDQKENITITCSYGIFILPIVFELLVVIFFWINPFVGCSFSLMFKPHMYVRPVPSSSETTEQVPIVVEKDDEFGI